MITYKQYTVNISNELIKLYKILFITFDYIYNMHNKTKCIIIRVHNEVQL
jgi:hypothetical protein